jgi:hypothetical protein
MTWPIPIVRAGCTVAAMNDIQEIACASAAGSFFSVPRSYDNPIFFWINNPELSVTSPQ